MQGYKNHTATNYQSVDIAFSGFLDFYLAFYPAIQLWKLQMPVKRKFTLSIALGLGLVYVHISLLSYMSTWVFSNKILYPVPELWQFTKLPVRQLLPAKIHHVSAYILSLPEFSEKASRGT